MKSVYPIGTTVYRPERCANGFTIAWSGMDVRLFDMNGNDVRSWRTDEGRSAASVDRARLLPNGRIVVQRGGMMGTDGLLQEYDWEGQVVWEYLPEGRIPHAGLLGPHHDVNVCTNGNYLTICREAVPARYLSGIREPSWKGQVIYGDTIIEVDRSSNVVWQWHAYEHLDLEHKRLLASPGWPAGKDNSTVCDWTHVNTVQSLPENRWFDAGDGRFRPGNVLISPRQLDTVYLIDRGTGRVVWEYSGDYFGGLSGQHEPHMIEKGLPGEGNITIFDNGASPWNDLGHAGASYVLEIDPVTGKVVWVYDRWLRFHSTYTSSAQRLWNGNTLICESNEERLFEVTPEKEIVWEHIRRTPRSYRYPYDHCPQTRALDVPEELPVTPPAEMRIPPDGRTTRG